MTGPGPTVYTTSELKSALTRLSIELDGLWRDQPSAVRAIVFVVGGVALAHRLKQDRTHKDVDVAVDDAVESSVMAAAVQVGGDLSLGHGWLDSGWGLFVQVGKPDRYPEEFARSNRVVIQIASLEYLLVMKLVGCRDAKDDESLALICRSLGLPSLEQAEALLAWYYPGHPMDPRATQVVAKFLIEAQREDLNNGMVI